MELVEPDEKTECSQTPVSTWWHWGSRERGRAGDCRASHVLWTVKITFCSPQSVSRRANRGHTVRSAVSGTLKSPGQVPLRSGNCPSSAVNVNKGSFPLRGQEPGAQPGLCYYTGVRLINTGARPRDGGVRVRHPVELHQNCPGLPPCCGFPGYPLGAASGSCPASSPNAEPFPGFKMFDSTKPARAPVDSKHWSRKWLVFAILDVDFIKLI